MMGASPVAPTASPYRARPAYRYALEDSVYVAPRAGRRGLGSALLTELIRRAEALGYRRMIAVVGDSGNEASIGFHLRHGFKRSGTLPSVGFKFGRWVDSVLLERPLGEGDKTLPQNSIRSGRIAFGDPRTDKVALAS